MQRTFLSVNKSARYSLYWLLPILAISFNSFGQNPAEFSGKWIFNNGKSSSIYAGMASVMVLTQTGDEINIEITQVQGDTEPTSLSEKYIIGTTLKVKNTTITTSWTEDKQSFSILEVKGDARVLKVYSLNEGGKTLEVKSDENLPAGFIRHTVMIYNKAL